jgi:hypothetical protein
MGQSMANNSKAWTYLVVHIKERACVSHNSLFHDCRGKIASSLSILYMPIERQLSMDAAKIEALATSETNLETGMLALRLNRVGKAKSIIPPER